MSPWPNPVVFITTATDDPGDGLVLDVSSTESAAKQGMVGRIGFCYRWIKVLGTDGIPHYTDPVFVRHFNGDDDDDDAQQPSATAHSRRPQLSRPTDSR